MGTTTVMAKMTSGEIRQMLEHSLNELRREPDLHETRIHMLANDAMIAELRRRHEGIEAPHLETWLREIGAKA